MFKSCRNYLKKYYLCQKSAKSGSARIWKCVLTTPSGGHLFNQGHNGFQNCGKLFINWEAARGRCSLIFNVTAFSNVKLHILGKAIWLTIFFNHLWIDYSKYDIYHQYFAQKQVNCVFFKTTILIPARASQSYSKTALICTHFEQLSYFHMEAKSLPLCPLPSPLFLTIQEERERQYFAEVVDGIYDMCMKHCTMGPF